MSYCDIENEIHKVLLHISFALPKTFLCRVYFPTILFIFILYTFLQFCREMYMR